MKEVEGTGETKEIEKVDGGSRETVFSPLSSLIHQTSPNTSIRYIHKFPQLLFS